MHRAAAIVLLFLFLAFGLRLEQLGVRAMQVSLVFDLHELDWRRMTAGKSGAQAPAEMQTQSSPQPPSPADGTGAANANPNPNDASANPDKPDFPVSLDIAQISRDGTSVFAGKSAPFAQVTVLDGTTEVASVTALANGDWSVATEHKFANADAQIHLKAAEHSDKNPAQHGNSGDPASSPVFNGITPGAPPSAQSGASANSAASPSAQLMKEFEGVVATAREEAKREKTDIVYKDAARDTSSSLNPAAIALSSPAAQASVDAHVPAPVTSNAAQSPTVTTAVPITFVYNEPTLTPDGQGAARLLLEYVRLKKFGTIALSGHADERGSQAYNMELSRQRLVTIERVLRDGGYRGQIDLVPKGSSEPFNGVVRSRFQREDLLQLDRRVELRVAK